MNAIPPMRPGGNVELPSAKGRGDENFPVGSVLISRAHRPHVHAYYDFVRAADDISDSAALAADDKVARLDAMEAALRGGDAADAVSPCAARLRASLARTGLPANLATDLLVAFRRDATVLRIPDWDALLDYCRWSANPVGRFLLALHGEDASDGTPLARASDALCTSLQITNHLQDCADDLRALDRSYLPGDWLRREGIGVDAVLAPATGPALARVFGRVLDGVDELNRVADGLCPLVRDRRMRLEAAVIVRLAHALARRLRRGDPLAGRVALRRRDIALGALRSLAHLPSPRAVRRSGGGTRA